ncbi:MAG: FliM/FliN family flagellar motor switch protein [Candidatus Latescibacterota bacterium]|jgi:flagellar motor switch protein FliN/FliY
MASVDERSNLRYLGDLEVEAVVELGRQRVPLSRVRELRQGEVLRLDVLAGEAQVVRVNGVPLAQGESVVVNERKGIRLTRMTEPDAVS